MANQKITGNEKLTDNKRDPQQAAAALERAVIKGPDAVREFYSEHAGQIVHTAIALGLACRYGGIETVKILLEHGADFTSIGKKRKKSSYMDKFELMVLPNGPVTLPRKHGLKISRTEQLDILRLLHERNVGDMGEILFWAILKREFEFAEVLLGLGAALSPDRLKLITGSAGFVNPAENVRREDRMEVRKAIASASDDALMRMIDLFTQCPEVDKVAVYDLDVLNIDFNRHWKSNKNILERFCRPEMLKFMLEKTTMRKVVTRRMIVEEIVSRDDAETLQWLIQNGYLNRRSEIEMLLGVLDGSEEQHTEMYALAVAHNAAHPPKDKLSIPTDPFAASLLRKIWKYESCADGKEVRILRYVGDNPAITVPPRIGRRPVTEIAQGALVMKFGLCRSAAFPGSIKSIPECFGYETLRRNIQDIILEDGILAIQGNAFAGTNIQEVTVPQSVMEIGEAAFANCTRLKKAILPSGLGRLPGDLFRGCENLVDVELPEDLHDLPSGIFNGCLMLKIPDLSCFESIGAFALASTGINCADISSVQDIGSSVFENCRNLQKVILPEGISRIPNGLFSGCTSLENLPELTNITSLGSRAFSGTGVKHVEISENVRSIGRGVFKACEQLESIRIKTHLRDIPKALCEDCTKLESVELPHGVKVIGERAFQGCSSLKSIDIPGTVREISKKAFAGSGLTQISIPTAAKTSGAPAFRAITDFIGPFDIPFLDENLSDLVLPEVQPDAEIAIILNEDSFRSSGLRSVRIPYGCRVGAHAFAECADLTEAYVEGGVALYAETFKGCGALTTVVLGHGCTCVPTGMCASCSSLKRVHLPETIAHIESEAFANSGLRDFVIPDGVTQIGRHAFAGSTIERIVIPDTVNQIGEGAFAGCRNLCEVVLPASMRKIPRNMFDGCKSLREIVLPDTLQEIGVAAFKDSGLTHIEIPNGVKIIAADTFRSCAQLQNAELGKSVSAIRQRAFSECFKLRTIKLPDTLIEIEPRSFGGCSFSEICIPASVQQIRKNAFAGCSHLKLIRLMGDHTHVASKTLPKGAVVQRFTNSHASMSE